MASEYVHNNPRDPVEERFERLEVQVPNISHNMNFLMVDLERNIKQLRDYGGSNLEIILVGKSGDQEDSGKELQKEYEKE